MKFRYNFSKHIMVDIKFMTCSAILGLLDKDDDFRASHKLLNIERIMSKISEKISKISAETLLCELQRLKLKVNKLHFYSVLRPRAVIWV